MSRGDTTSNTAAQVAYDERTDIRTVTRIIKHRKVVSDIKKYGKVIDSDLRGWGYTHMVEVPYEADREVGYSISGHYHVTL